MLIWFLVIGCVHAHVTLNPNTGAEAGSYFFTVLKIPHGTVDLETSKVVIKVPHGVLAVKPEDVAGWKVSVTRRAIPPYQSHGKTVSTGPDTITYEAETPEDTLHNDHLLTLGLQVKFGCKFTKSATATFWQGEHTLWWPTVQYYAPLGSLKSTEKSEWIGVPSGENDAWGTAKPKPSPYTYLYSSSKCVDAEDASQIGMVWENVLVPVASDKGVVKNVGHIKSILNEELLSMKESAHDAIREQTPSTVAIVGLTLSCVSVAQMMILLGGRAFCSRKRYTSLLGIETPSDTRV